MRSDDVQTAPAAADLIDGAAVSGRVWFRCAAAGEVVSVAALVAAWGCLCALVEGLVDGGDPRSAWGTATSWAMAGFVIALVLRAVGAAVADGAAERGAGRVAAGLRHEMIPRLVDSSAAGQVRAVAGAAMLLDHPEVIAEYLRGMRPLRIAAGPATVLILAAVAIAYWPVAVMLLIATTLMPINLKLAGQATLSAGRAQMREIHRLSALVLESIAGMATLRSLYAVAAQREILRAASLRLGTATRRVLRMAFLSSLVMDVVVTFAIAVCASYVGLVLLGYLDPSWAPELDLGAGLFVLLLCPVYFVPVQRAARGFHARDDALVAAEELVPILRLDSGDAANAPTSGPISVRFEDVRLDGDAGEPILDAVVLDVPAGRWTAITGASGAGKTTLLRLAAGVQSPDAGAVHWSSGAERPAHAWLGAETVILAGTIAENIRLGDRDADPAGIRAAAHVAGLDDLLARSPAGLDTRVGDGGARLSAGEARRVAIARMVIARRRLWILDEPTAHLDPVTESAVLDTLRGAAGADTTVLVATHSPRIVAVADRRHDIIGGAVVAVAPGTAR